MRTRMILGAAIVGACLGGGVGAFAAEDAKASPEQQVLNKMYISNQAEVQMGQLAQQRAQSDQVRQYADMLAKDHSQSLQEVQSLAQRQGIQLSSAQQEPSKEQEEMQKKIDKLQQAQGADFDKEFLAAMVDSHGKTIDKLSKLQNDVQDPSVQQLIDKSLPVLEQHRQQAQDLKRQVG